MAVGLAVPLARAVRPATTASAWLTVGAAVQLLLVIATCWLYVRGRRSSGVRAYRPIIGVTVALAAVAAIALTTAAASRSYCQPGTAGYAESYCET